jgi:hypothetical protein
VLALHAEQRSLLSALQAVESALQEAQASNNELSALRQRCEAALEAKCQAVAALKRELRDAHQVAEQVRLCSQQAGEDTAQECVSAEDVCMCVLVVECVYARRVCVCMHTCTWLVVVKCVNHRLGLDLLVLMVLKPTHVCVHKLTRCLLVWCVCIPHRRPVMH